MFFFRHSDSDRAFFLDGLWGGRYCFYNGPQDSWTGITRVSSGSDSGTSGHQDYQLQPTSRDLPLALFGCVNGVADLSLHDHLLPEVCDQNNEDVIIVRPSRELCFGGLSVYVIIKG